MVVSPRRSRYRSSPLRDQPFPLNLQMQKREREHRRRRGMFENNRFVPCRVERFAFDCRGAFVSEGIGGTERYSRFDKRI
jgi:hypothetical protein